jgi:hypothetical protein
VPVLGPVELAALGLASARGTQLIVHDSLLDGWRERLELWHAAKHTSRIRTFIRDLCACIYCVGFHTSWIALLTYLLASGQWSRSAPLVHGIEAFAIAGLQMLINRWDDTLPAGGH